MKARESTKYSKVFMYASLISGVAAAYIMYRRGESLFTIARKTVTNPIGSLVSEASKIV